MTLYQGDPERGHNKVPSGFTPTLVELQYFVPQDLIFTLKQVCYRFLFNDN